MAFLNLDRVNVVKRGMVREVCEIAEQSGVVDRVVVFGSAVRDDCTEDSDVDLCLTVPETTTGRQMFDLHIKICEACGHDADILDYAHVSGALKREIDNKGVVVYVLAGTGRSGHARRQAAHHLQGQS